MDNEITNYKLTDVVCPACGGPVFARHSRKTGNGFAGCGKHGCDWTDFEASYVPNVDPRALPSRTMHAPSSGGGSVPRGDYSREIIQKLDRILELLDPGTGPADVEDPF